jgi:FMN reductase [NAD(P)H]
MSEMKNSTLKTLLDHRSYRDYTAQAVSDEDLAAILSCAHRAPSSVNGQHVSVVVIRDEKCRAAIAELAGGQAWIAKAPVFLCVVIDFAKTDAAARHVGIQQVLHESLEGFAVGCVDAGIVLASAMTAARSLGLGSVAIGGIRANPAKLIELLGLPHLSFPIVGCSIGHFVSEPAQKPRLPIHTFRHDETWQGVPDAATVDAYDAELKRYWQVIGRPDGPVWSRNTANRYSAIYHPETKPVAARQGFLVDK